MNTAPSFYREARTLVIDREQAGRRLDNFLFRHCPGVPRSRVYRVLRRGEVRVNSRRCRADYRLENGDRVRVPPLRLKLQPDPPPRHQLLSRVLLEDEDLLVIDKPAGLAVHGGSGCNGGLVESLRLLRPDLPYLDLAHRLDRETSGCILLVKKPATLKRLHALFRSARVHKRYLALLVGPLHGKIRQVDAELERGRLRSGERVAQVRPGGRASSTRFELLESFHLEDTEYSLVEAHPLTGRMHQIRAHAAHIGTWVAGDQKYGQGRLNRQLAALGLRRLFLHAQGLHFSDQGRTVRLHCELPEELQAFLEILRSRCRYATINAARGHGRRGA